MDSDDSIYDNFDKYVGSGLEDDEMDLRDEGYVATTQMATLSIDSKQELIIEDKIVQCSGANQDRIDWYKNGITIMTASVVTLGTQRTEASKQFNDVSNKYDQTKKTLYNLIETGVSEGSISDKESSNYKDEIKLIDRRALTDMNIDQNSRKRSRKRARRI